LQTKGIPKALAVIFVMIIIISAFLIIFVLLFPLLFDQLGNLFNQIIVFIEHISNKFGINVSEVETILLSFFNSTLDNLGTMVSSGAIGFISKAFNYLTIIIVVISVFIYMLLDMDKIRNRLGKSIYRKSKKFHKLVTNIDIELKKYFVSFLKIMVITFFEYGICFLIVGHPNFLLLGLMAALASFIPCFGGMLVNAVAAITAFVIGKSLFIKTVIVFFILSLLDSYVINPIVYGKSNKIPPVITIFAVFAGGIIFGLMGIVVSMPISIILLTIYRFYKNEKEEI